LRTVPIGCIRQDHSHRDLLFNRLPHLLQCNRRLGLKLNPFRDACLLAAFGILASHLRQIQPPGDGKTRIPIAHRKTYCCLAVIVFADLTAVLPGNSHRVLSLFGKTGVIHDPRHHRAILLHGWKHLPSYLTQHLFVVPGRVRNQVMQRLVHAANIVRSQTCSHWLNALAISGQQQSVQ
jgi:hypothetical protein